MRTVWLAPSDIRWLIDKCPRCWWLKTRNLPAPSDKIPAIFGKIDRGMRAGIGVSQLRAMGVEAKELVNVGKLRSAPIDFEDLKVSLVIGGYLDRLVLLDDDTWGIIEYKTTQPKPESLALYSRQVHAYLFALENPAIGEGREVTQISLVVFDPSEGAFKLSEDMRAAQTGTLSVHRVEIDRFAFQDELRHIAEIAASDYLPASGGGCDVCAHANEVVAYQNRYPLPA